MSLLFTGGGSDKVAHGNTGTDPTTGSVYMWIYPTAITNTGLRIFDKSNTTGFWRIQFVNDSGATSGAFRGLVDYTTTDANATSVANVLVVNTWNFIAMTFLVNNAPKLYWGNQTTQVAEVTYNVTPVANVGTRVTDAGQPVLVGAQTGSSVLSFPGRIALCHWIPGTELSLADLKAHQFRPFRTANSKILSLYLVTAAVQDWSGAGNNGTVTGTSVAAQLPLEMSMVGYGKSPMLGGTLVGVAA